MDSWIDFDSIQPVHAQKCRTLGSDGREFDCEFWKWDENTSGHFKLISSVFHHDNVTHWKPLEG